jgi:competence protein ComEC
MVVGCIALHHCATLPPLAALLAAALFITVLVGTVWANDWSRWLMAVMLGFSWAAWQAHSALGDRISPDLEGQNLTVVGYIDELPLYSPNGVRFGFRVTSCVEPIVECPVDRRIRLGWSTSFSRMSTHSSEASPPITVAPGEVWQFNVRLKRPVASVNFGLFDAELRMLEEGISATGTIRKARAGDPGNEWLGNWHFSLRTGFEAARAAGRHALEDALRGERADAAGVLIALAFGDQAAIAGSDWDMFNRTGVGHLMSISGLHITMLAAIAGALAGGLLRTQVVARSGLLTLIPAPFLKWGFALTVAFVYSGLAGWGIPAQRTCWMLAVAGWAVVTGRSRSIARVLCLAAAVVCVLDPWAPMSAGFWLSFAAVAAIVIHAGAIRRSSAGGHATSRLTFLVRLVTETARSQWAASLSLLPLGALFFSSLSLISPLANAWAVPLVSGFITPAVLVLAGTSLLSPALASGVAMLVVSPTGWMLDALRVMADWPGGAMVLAQPDTFSLLLAVVSVAVVLAPRPVPWRACWLAGLLPLMVRGPDPVPQGGFRLTAFDIGQGMAVLIEAEGKRLLYDTGPSWDAGVDAGARVVVPALRTQGISTLDTLIISHADTDHSGGAASVLKLVGAKEVFSSIAPEHRLLTGIEQHRGCMRGHAWQWGSVRFEFLHPGPEFPPGAARSPSNARSCVLKVTSPAGSVLLAGDIEARQEIDLVERAGEALRSDLLLAPHHGSNTSSTERFLSAVAPDAAIFQVGYRNRFRHPTEKVLARYRAADIQILRTDHDGALRIHAYSGNRPWRIERARATPSRYWRVQTRRSD